MTGKRLRSIRIQAAVIAVLPFLMAGCFFNLRENKDFRSWYYGDPGLAGALGEADCDRYADNIQGRRHPYYLHFRTPEVLLQPQGGGQYPERTTVESRVRRSDAHRPACDRVAKGWETFRFDAVDAGLVDAVLPYRKASVVNDRDISAGQESLAYAQGVVYNTGLAVVMKAPVYIIHDILKTLYIPVAGTYYMFKSDEPSASSAEDRQVPNPSAPVVPLPAEADETQESTATAVEDRAPSSETPETEEEEEEFVVMPAEDPLADDPAPERPTAIQEENGAPVGPETDTTESQPQEPPAAAPGGGIVEEDLLKAAPSVDRRPAADEAGDAPDQPGEAQPPAVDQAPKPPTTGPPPGEAVPAEIAPPLEAIKKVRISKSKLRKKVAFIGFHSRAVNVDEDTKTNLQGRLWPVFEEECQSNLTLVRQGDTGYPAVLNALMRDPFGHLNSFELTTVARFNGLNAIISGTIIDIRISKEISGILWYKTPEGQLRITILMEVYDAETGTKLFDHTYIREKEVEELEPGAGEKLRSEDQPMLDEALQRIAEDMGDDICDALKDQPWRAFVSGIKGKRITLSAGQSAGLLPGNILGVYNSQIIDGLNNQQFFLTGEKIGRIQLINLADDRSEAILIEGQGLRDYSVAIPE